MTVISSTRLHFLLKLGRRLNTRLENWLNFIAVVFKLRCGSILQCIHFNNLDVSGQR